MSLAKATYLAGVKHRNPGLYDWYDFLKETERWELGRLKEYQLKEVKKLLLIAEKHSLFYKNYFRKHGFDPVIHSLDDLKQLPPVSKEQLISENDKIHTHLNFNKKFYCETSGSSGQTLTFWRNEQWDSANRAAILRGQSWYNVLPWESNIYFWGYNIETSKKLKTRILDILQNRYRVFDYRPETLSRLIGKLKSTTYMHGYSSVIYELAKLINQQQITMHLPKLKMIKGTSEKIHPHYQEEINKAFGRKMISEYGAAEASIVAFECAAGNMHVTMENVLLEVEEGEIIVTNLIAHSFPIIRYKLGDYIKLSESDTCACGMEHLVIEEVRGRVGKNIYGELHKYPSLTLYYVFKNLFFKYGLKFNYQCVQEKKGSLVVLIKEPFSNQGEKLIRTEFEKYFKSDITISVIFSQNFHSYSEKLKDFISKIE
ncbi:phenylacetate--CoA ligase family protein [Roseivirga sp. E12]|uniref:phenylacetate--CoA ligase family protein n=1 Tax=Roseivirga sp. E12 TaxID=2819237 RepID=UPI001ABD0B61|nr:phenylacetate--CoA ligase family protein [Roseivirga sp. E12]MBO3699071.1 phenylacetate--CoA ligase family protein [Roseivirga sp. E12]